MGIVIETGRGGKERVTVGEMEHTLESGQDILQVNEKEESLTDFLSKDKESCGS